MTEGAAEVFRFPDESDEAGIRRAVDSCAADPLEVYLGIESSGRIVGVPDRDRAESTLRAIVPEAEIVHLDLHSRPVVVAIRRRGES